MMQLSVSGYYAWRNRPLSARALRHLWLTEQIQQVHTASYGTYGSRRVHAELRLGRGIIVGHGAIEMLMRRAGRQRCCELAVPSVGAPPPRLPASTSSAGGLCRPAPSPPSSTTSAPTRAYAAAPVSSASTG